MAVQIGCSHIVVDSLCLRPRSLARETGHAGYWSRITYEERLDSAEGDRGVRYQLRFLSEDEFSPFMMYDEQREDQLPLHCRLTVERTANGVVVHADSTEGGVVTESLRDRISRMYASATPHEVTMSLLRDRCVTPGDSVVIDDALARTLFEQGDGERLRGAVTLHTVRVFDTLDIEAVELRLLFSGRSGSSGTLEEVTDHDITFLVEAGTGDPIRITEHRVRSLRDAHTGSPPRNVTYIMRCLRFSVLPDGQSE
jgi:hypothetical protein